MLFGSHWALIGLVLAFLFALSGVLSAKRRGGQEHAGKPSRGGAWVVAIVTLSLVFAAFCVVAPNTVGRTSSTVARRFERAVQRASRPRPRQYAGVEQCSAQASARITERSNLVERGAARYVRGPVLWLARSGVTRQTLVWNSLLGLAIAALLYVGYVFLDAATRGHFTGKLRVLSVIAFISACAALAALRAQGVANL